MNEGPPIQPAAKDQEKKREAVFSPVEEQAEQGSLNQKEIIEGQVREQVLADFKKNQARIMEDKLGPYAHLIQKAANDEEYGVEYNKVA